MTLADASSGAATISAGLFRAHCAPGKTVSGIADVESAAAHSADTKGDGDFPQHASALLPDDFVKRSLQEHKVDSNV